jgi:hypothetical protein
MLTRTTGLILTVFAICCACIHSSRLMAATAEPTPEPAVIESEMVPQPAVKPNGHQKILEEIHTQKQSGAANKNALLEDNELGLSAQSDPSYCCRGPYGKFYDPCRAGGSSCSSCNGHGCTSCNGRGYDNGADFCGDNFCGPPGRFWIRADYISWWTSGAFLPPLVTTSPAGTPIADAGVLPNATILFGNTTVNNGYRSGSRVTLGAWITCDHTWGVQGDFFDIGGLSTNYTASSSSTGSPIIARPFFDVDPATGQPRQASEIVSYPNQYSGTITVDQGDYLQSAGLTLRGLLCCGDICGMKGGGCGSCGSDDCNSKSCRVDVLAGYRFFKLTDSLNIHENVLGLANSPFPNTTFDVTDSFRTLNEFHGAELGLSAQTFRGPWSVELLVKMAAGINHQNITLTGATNITQRTAGVITSQATYDSGVYVLDTNRGSHNRDDFVVIPQLRAEIGYQINCNLRAYMSYDFLYWATVARAADQIDQNIDSARIPPPATHQVSEPFPAYDFHASSFWAQGVGGGLEFRY